VSDRENDRKEDREREREKRATRSRGRNAIVIYIYLSRRNKKSGGRVKGKKGEILIEHLDDEHTGTI
jgi:hypothetical protein